MKSDSKKTSEAQDRSRESIGHCGEWIQEAFRDFNLFGSSELIGEIFQETLPYRVFDMHRHPMSKPCAHESSPHQRMDILSVILWTRESLLLI